MGRRSKRRAGKSRRAKPDAHFSAGPLEFARFGNVMMSRSRATPAQWRVLKKELAVGLPGLVTEIDSLVDRIAGRIASLPPEILLQRAWWEFSALMISSDQKGTESEQVAAMRMIDYVQSVIASVTPVLPHPDRVEDEDWRQLTEDVRTLFALLTLDYQVCHTAALRAADPHADMELEEFRFRAETLWMNVRGDRHQPHQTPALLEILTPHSDALARLFKIDAPTLVAEMAKLLEKRSHGLKDLFSGWERLRDVSLDRLERLAEETGIFDLDVLRDKVFEDPELASLRDRIVGELWGLDLFDVERITLLPKPLLDELAWSPGEEREFFAPGEFRGWPLRIWPTMKRPFIRLSGRTLCFDTFALFDNLYRVIQRTIFRIDPGYKQTWSDRQKEVSESLPFIYLERLLPGARIFRPVYYRHRTATGPAQWCEADGLLVYDEHLFVIEVKAGAFTYTSPATDLPAHIESLKNLVLSPANQGNRFIDYLESSPEVALFSEDHEEIGRLRRSEFRHVILCAITLDNFTELAARANHLAGVGVDVGGRPIWVLSIDDLRVYADMFRNPLRFLHFVEQRMLAARSPLVDLNDEQDHLGLYFENNNYSLHAEELRGKSDAKLLFDGYRRAIDNYYTGIVIGEPIELPQQETPARLYEIVEFLASSAKHRRSRVASFLLDAEGDLRETIARSIDQILADNDSLRRVRPMSIYGDYALTLVVWSPAVPREETMARRHTRVVMAAAGESSRFLLELEYSSTGVLKEVHWRDVDLSDLSPGELAGIHRAGRKLRGQRLAAAQENGRIGRNDSCPCGSGRKYKRCCRNRTMG